MLRIRSFLMYSIIFIQGNIGETDFLQMNNSQLVSLENVLIELYKLVFEYLQKRAGCLLFSTAFKVPLEIIEFLFFGGVACFEFIEN